MKRLLFGLIATILLTNVAVGQTPVVKKDFYFFYVNWDSWGRTSKNCKGFGLCNFQSCSACCVESDVIVSCLDKTAIPNSGTIKIPVGQKEGTLVIQLNPKIPDHKDAIDQKKILYLDSDLTNETITLKNGNYVFDATIGKFGGYTVKARIK